MKERNLNPKTVFRLVGLMAFIFITLKLMGVITWPWWILTVSLWFCSATLLVVVIISFVIAIFEEQL